MIYVLLPVFNEEAHIKKLLEGIRRALSEESFKIVVVNDGSTDRTVEIIRELNFNEVHVISHNINLSIGAVYQTGILNIIKNAEDEDILVLMESDLTSPPEVIKTILQAISEQKLDLVIASRYKNEGGYENFSWMRTIYSKSANLLMRYWFPIQNVSDYTIFFRGYRISLLKSVFSYFGNHNCLQTSGFVSNTELLVKCSLFTDQIGEIPFIYNYAAKHNASKLRVFWTIIEYFSFLFFMKDIIRKIRLRDELSNSFSSGNKPLKK